MAAGSTPYLRVLRKAPQPLGLYIRPGRNDHHSLLTFLSHRAPAFSGVIFNATTIDRHQELFKDVVERKLDAVLDPRTQPLATVGGFTPALGRLPWGMGRVNAVSDFTNRAAIQRVAESIATFVVANRFTQVIAPTHLIADASDPWIDIDVELTYRLRLALDRLGQSKIPIAYSLATSYATFRHGEKRALLIDRLRSIAAQSIWLNVDGFGSSSTPTAAVKYIDAGRDFHALGLPIIADHTGGLVGLALASIGAVGGLAHGITLGERFSTGHWHRPPGKAVFSRSPRVYVPSLDLMLSRNDAELLFETGGKARAAFGCRDTACCPRGIEDMVAKPSLHFLHQRTRELAGLSAIPESIRAQRFLEEHLRPATDKALLATKLQLPTGLAQMAEKQRKRLDDLRIVLGEYVRKRPSNSYAKLPLTRAAREARS